MSTRLGRFGVSLETEQYMKARCAQAILIFTTLISSPCFGSNLEVLLQDLRSHGYSSTDCGLYALIAVSNSIGTPVSYTELFSPEYESRLRTGPVSRGGI